MSDIISERSGSILRIQLNRPAKKNAMTSSMYISMAEFLEDGPNDDQVRGLLLHLPQVVTSYADSYLACRTACESSHELTA